MRLATLICALLLLAAPAGATVYCQPADTTAALGTEVSIRVVTTEVTDLLCYKLVYRYDPRVMALDGIDPGELLIDAPGDYVGFVVGNVSGADTARYDACVLGGHIEGAGILAYLRFRLIGPGDASLVCQTIDFRDSFNNSSPECAGAFVRADVPLAAGKTTWGRIKGLWR